MLAGPAPLLVTFTFIATGEMIASLFDEKRAKSYRIDSTKHVVLQQLINKVKSARNAHTPKPPKDGWIRTIRQTLGMSGAQFAKRMGYTRNKVSILERKEASGDITINQLKELESENRRLKKMYAEERLKAEIVTEALEKKW